MEIYTSYFSMGNKIKAKFKGKVCMLDITRFGLVNSGCNFRYSKVAPDANTLNLYKYGAIDEHEYCKRYREETLKYLNIDEVFTDFDIYKRATGADVIVLVCYEIPSKFCHRHLLAQWITENSQYTVEELTF